MVSDKIIVILLIVAILLSLISTIVALSMDFGVLSGFGGGSTTIIYQAQPEEERANVGVSVGGP